MSARFFVDTNLLVYSRDASEPEKQARAALWMEALWERGNGRVSAQVLHEFYVTVTRKLDPGMSTERARAEVRDLSTWNPVPVDETLLERAWAVESRFGFSFWDALIVAAAEVAECDYLLTEDLQADQQLDTLTVVDPFATTPEQLTSR
jgi:predicted nucleic acid-binding protein